MPWLDAREMSLPGLKVSRRVMLKSDEYFFMCWHFLDD
jgi:hypothetical protein